jgi:hypothetical protein
MADQAADWAGVGSTKVPSNQPRVSGLNRAIASVGLTCPECQVAPTNRRARSSAQPYPWETMLGLGAGVR